jgi:hypothetical protein
MGHRITSEATMLVKSTGYMDTQEKKVLENGLPTHMNTPVTSIERTDPSPTTYSRKPRHAHWKNQTKQISRPTTTISNTRTGQNRWGYHTSDDTITTYQKGSNHLDTTPDGSIRTIISLGKKQ